MESNRLPRRAGSSSNNSVVEKHEIEADRDVTPTINSVQQVILVAPQPQSQYRSLARQPSATEKFDSEQSEKTGVKPVPINSISSASSNTNGGIGTVSSISTKPMTTTVLAVPKIGASSVFREVPRGKDTVKPLTLPQPLAIPSSAGDTIGSGAAGRSEPVTVPVRIIANGEKSADLKVTSQSSIESNQSAEPARLPEFVDWSARTTNALYKQLEDEVAKLRCDKKQLTERLDRSLLQSDSDRQLIRGLQTEVRQLRDKAYDFERHRAARGTELRRDEDESKNRTGRWNEFDRTNAYAGTSAANASRYSSSTDSVAKQREQKLLQVQMENDTLKRKVEDLEDSIRRYERQIKTSKEENQELRSRLESDTKRFAKFEERVKQLESALTKANQDNLQLIDQMRSQLFLQQSKRNHAESSVASTVSNVNTIRAPLTRNTLTENTVSHSSVASTSTLHSAAKLNDSSRSTITTSLASAREKDSSRNIRQHTSRTAEKENPIAKVSSATSAASNLTKLSSVTSTHSISSAALPKTTSTIQLPSSSGISSQQPSTELYSLSSVSNLGLRRYLSLPPSARRQMTSRYISHVQEAPVTGSVLERTLNDAPVSQSAYNTPRSVKTNDSGLSLLRAVGSSKPDVTAASETTNFTRSSSIRGTSTTSASSFLHSSSLSKPGASLSHFDQNQSSRIASLSSGTTKSSTMLNGTSGTNLNTIYSGASAALSTSTSLVSGASTSRTDISSIQPPVSTTVPALASVSSVRLPGGQPTSTADQTSLQLTSRLTLQEYREYLKERRRRLADRDGDSLMATELPAEAV